MLKINNTLDIARWESIPCLCEKGLVLESFPIKDCLHCKFEQCWLSVPTKEFEVKEPVIKNAKIISHTTRKIKEITIVRGKKYEDVMGWQY